MMQYAKETLMVLGLWDWVWVRVMVSFELCLGTLTPSLNWLTPNHNPNP